MKRKFILITTILLGITSAVAETGNGYRIISEETHSTPGFNFHVEHIAPGTAEALKKRSRSEREAFIKKHDSKHPAQH